jgi:hypothetical protein
MAFKIKKMKATIEKDSSDALFWGFRIMEVMYQNLRNKQTIYVKKLKHGC